MENRNTVLALEVLISKCFTDVWPVQRDFSTGRPHVYQERFEGDAVPEKGYRSGQKKFKGPVRM